jgi:hypothetical protein
MTIWFDMGFYLEVGGMDGAMPASITSFVADAQRESEILPAPLFPLSLRERAG